MGRIFLLGVALCACGGAASPPRPPAPRPDPPDLTTFLPAGADWVVVARPKELWKAPETRRALRGSIGEADLALLARRTGVDLREVDEAVAAGYGPSVLWLARGGYDAREVRRLLRDRLRPVERDDPGRGLVGALLGRTVGLRRLGQRAIAFEDGGAVLDRIERGAGPIQPGGTLAGRLGPAPLILLRTGSLGLPVESGAGVLLSHVDRSGFSLEPAQGRLRVRVVLLGDLPSTAEENLRALVQSLGGSGLGRAFGADDAARRVGVTMTPAGAELELDFEPASVDTGVRTLFVSDLRALVSEQPNGSIE